MSKKDEKIKDDIKRGWRRNQTNNEFLIRFKSFCNFKFCHGGSADIFKSGLFTKEVHSASRMDPKWTVNLQSRHSIKGNALNWTKKQSERSTMTRRRVQLGDFGVWKQTESGRLFDWKWTVVCDSGINPKSVQFIRQFFRFQNQLNKYSRYNMTHI